MARQVLPVVGFVAGFFLPGGPGVWSAIGGMIGNAIDPVQIQGPKIGDVAQQTSSEGVYQPIYFGTCAGAGNIIAQGPNIIKKKKDSGKGGPETTTEYLYKTFAIRIGKGWKGAITGVSRIWEDGKLVYDIRAESTIVAESIEFAKGFRLYLGTQDQLPDPDLEAIYGIGNTPAYVGRAYIVFPRKNITDRKSISDYRFEVVASGAITPPVVAGKWIFGPVTENGAAGGSQAFYRTFDDPADVYAGTLHALPPWLSSLSRISTANGKVWLHGDANSAFSSDHGVTWTECDTDLPSGYNVSWNGDYYYCRTLQSLDGIAWTTIPGLTGPPLDTLGRDSDGLVVVAYSNGAFRFETTIDNGANWTVHSYGEHISYLATDGVQTQFTGNATTGRRTFDFSTYPIVSVEAAYTPYYGDGTWIRKGSSNRLLRSDGDGTSFSVVLFGTSLGNITDNTVAHSSEQHQWVIANVTAETPARWDLKYSTDDGLSWDAASTLYGPGANIAFIGGGVAPGEVTSDAVPLDEAVAKIHGLVYQDASKFDVSDLEGTTLRGLVLAGAYTGADAIRTLAGCEFFDSPESDKKIRHVRRGKPVVTVITEDDLVADSETSTREQAIEYPKKLNLDYQSEEADYAPAKATSSRSSRDARVTGEANVQVPVNMGADLAAQKAVILHKVAWADADGEVELTVSDRFIWLVPGDCIGLNLRGRVSRLRIDKMEYSPGTIKLTCRNDRQSAYTSNVTGIPPAPPTPPPPSIVGPTILAVGDWPAFLDTQDRLGMYFAVTGQTEAWHGAQVDRSTDGGANFSEADQFDRGGTTMGLLMDDVTAASRYFTDTTNVLRIRLYMDGEIESLTDAQFNSEGGAFMLGTPDGWELIQYRDAEQDTDGDWLLSYLKRGQLNTAPIAHAAGSTFVLLDNVHFVDAVTAWLGTDLTHRAVSYGRSPDGVPTQTGEYTGTSQREFPVASVSLSRNVDAITVTIVPRHRFGTEANPIRSINWERYSIEINDGISVSVAGTTADNLTFDASAMSSPITVAVAQRNRLTGDGPFVSESIA